jgi:hypothetical protein
MRRWIAGKCDIPAIVELAFQKAIEFDGSGVDAHKVRS